MTVRLRLLGEVRWEDGPITGERQQRLLAALVEAGATGASVSALVEEIWGDEPPAEPARALQVVVSRTRGLTEPEAVGRTTAGYRLGLSVDEVDHSTLLADAAAASAAAAAEDWTTALEHAERARAVTIAERDDDRALGRLARTAGTAQRTATRTAGIALSRLGRHADALPLLESTTDQRPDDDAVVEALLRGIAAERGAAAALDRYERHRSALADRLGTDPGPALQRLHAELLAADRPVRAGIRYDATELVGRDADLAALRALVASGRVTSIAGPGGLGKTRLAHVLARTTTHPVVHFVELVGVTAPEDLVGEVGSALGVRDSVVGRRALTPQQRADVRARIVQHLDAAPTLLVLDNCEHLVGAVADLVAYLVTSTPQLHVVTTTRAPLGIAAERVYQLGQLDTADGVELFTQRAHAARPGAVIEPEVTGELVGRLDGLPLAIELAAAKTRVMSVPEIARRLENRFALLRGGDRSAPDRHQTLLAVIDWSWNLLAEPERRALRWLSVFHDGFTLAAAETMLGPEALTSVEHLAEQSLLSIAEGETGLRYRMLETVREFGRMQLVDAGEDDEAARAHRDWAAAYAWGGAARLFGPDQFQAVDELRAEEGNLADVLRQALAGFDPATVVQVLGGLAPYWSIRGDHARLMVLAEAICAAVGQWTPPPELEDATRTAMTLTLTNTMIAPGGTPAPVLDLLERLGPGEEPRIRGLLLTTAAFQAGAESDFIAHLEEQARSTDRHVALSAYQWLSHGRENAGDVRGAVEAAERALALTEADDGPWTPAILRTQLSQLLMQLGDTTSAVRHAEAALPVLHRLHAADDALQLHSLLGLAALYEGDIATAERQIERIREVDDADGVFGGRMVRDLCTAELALARGDRETGLACYRSSVHRLRGLRFPGMPTTGLEPWVLFGEAAALTAFAHHGDVDDEPFAEGLADVLAERLARTLGEDNPLLDFPVGGLAMFALGAWGLLHERLPSEDAVRLLVLADLFSYNRTIPTMAWERIVPLVDERAPGVLVSLRGEYGERRGPELLDEARALVAALFT